MRLKRFVLAMVLLLPMCIKAQEQKLGSTQVLFKLFAKNGMGAQSAAAYGDYLVLVSKHMEKVGLYNLKKKKLVCVRRLTPKMEFRGKIDIFHANNSSFGVSKYAETDIFPLLYVSHRENNEMRGVLEVYRIEPYRRNEGSFDYDSIDVNLVQTVYYPPMTDENALGSPWTVIDREGNCMYTYSRNNRSKSPNKGVCRISKFNIPDLKRGKRVYLNDDDILDSYEIDYKAPLSQGACIHHGMLYIAQGVSPKKSPVWLRVVDLRRKQLIKSYDLKAAGFPTEPEGCFVYKNKLMLATMSKKIFKMNIPIK